MPARSLRRPVARNSVLALIARSNYNFRGQPAISIRQLPRTSARLIAAARLIILSFVSALQNGRLLMPARTTKATTAIRSPDSRLPRFLRVPRRVSGINEVSFLLSMLYKRSNELRILTGNVDPIVDG